MRSDEPLPIVQRLAALGRRAGRLQGPDAEEWHLKVEEPAPDFLQEILPARAVVFANNRCGDYLFLVPTRETVQVYWHEGALVEDYCADLGDLSASKVRPPSDHPQVHYFKSNVEVRPGDRVWVKNWLFGAEVGRVSYVPGMSPLKRELERDGLAWVRTLADDGSHIDSLVVDGQLHRGVRFVARGDADEGDARAT